MAFSRQQTIKDGLKVKIRRAKAKAKNHAKDKMGTIDKEWKLKHQDWITEAKQGVYASLVQKVTNDEKNRVASVMGRRDKIRGKD